MSSLRITIYRREIIMKETATMVANEHLSNIRVLIYLPIMRSNTNNQSFMKTVT